MNVTEVKEKVMSINSDSSYVLAAFTDEYMVDKWNDDSKRKICDKLELAIEIRVFNQDEEYKFFRTDIFKEFAYRLMNDSKNQLDSYDEMQYLDIDESPGNNDGYVYTTGGGKYKLPISNTKDAKVIIRYYLSKYEDTGRARIDDWRVVGFK